MPTYPVKNLETGEEKELKMSMKEYSEWREENPGWDKDWSKGTGGACNEGDWKNKLMNNHPGWEHIMKRASALAPDNAKHMH